MLTTRDYFGSPEFSNSKGREMKKIKILKDTVCGSKRVKKGDTVDASDAEATLLVNMKKAEKVDSAAATKEAITSEKQTRKSGK